MMTILLHIIITVLALIFLIQHGGFTMIANLIIGAIAVLAVIFVSRVLAEILIFITRMLAELLVRSFKDPYDGS